MITASKSLQVANLRMYLFSGIPILGPSSLSRTYALTCSVACWYKQPKKLNIIVIGLNIIVIGLNSLFRPITRQGYCVAQWQGRL